MMITKEQAEVLWNQSQAIYQFVMAGYTHNSARDAVQNNDLSRLRKDTKLGEKK